MSGLLDRRLIRLTTAAVVAVILASSTLAPRQAFGQRGNVGGPPVPGSPHADRLWLQTLPLDESKHLLLVVDPILKHVAVYHVDAAAGTITLKSSRDISADLQVDDFNAQEPKPAALRKMLEMKGAPPPR